MRFIENIYNYIGIENGPENEKSNINLFIFYNAHI
jgi:hypothetical protein